MKIRLLLIWNRLQESYWFIPGIFSLVAIIMSITVPLIEQNLTAGAMSVFRELVSIDAGDARTLLSVIIGSSMTVIGVVFSILIAVLANAATQFGPGLLPRFMRLKTTQVTLGVFLACFVYSMGLFTQLANLSNVDNSGPAISILVSVILGIVSFFVLIHFIHCITHFLQPLSIINSIANDLLSTLSTAYPSSKNAKHPQSSEADTTIMAQLHYENATSLIASRSGYLKAVDFEKLENIIEQSKISVDLCTPPGTCLLEGDTMARYASKTSTHDKLCEALQGVFLIAERRDSLQDPDYAMEQLVEIAVRALSPGVNAPFLALQCLNHICAALIFVARRSQPERLNLIGDNFWMRDWYGYDVLCNSAFSLLRQYGDSCEEIMQHLLSIIEKALGENIEPAYRKELLSHAALINERAELVYKQAAVCDSIRKQYQDIIH